MTFQNTKPATLIASATMIAASAAAPSNGSDSVNDFIARIKNPDEAVYGPAWQSAQKQGPAAVEPLVPLMAETDFELARRAKRALYRIVRHTSRPGAEQEAKEVEAKLVTFLKHDSPKVRREVLWMLSEIGGDTAVGPMASLLSDKEVGEDARCAVTRIPGQKATAALKSAFETAPESLKYALAESLRKRGEHVEGYATKKLVPTGQTTVIPLQPKTK